MDLGLDHSGAGGWSLRPGSPAAYAAAVILVAASTALFYLGSPWLTSDQVTLLYILVVGLVARIGGVRAGWLASGLAFAIVFYAFVPPYRVPVVENPSDLLTLAVFLLVALAAGTHTGGMMRKERDARFREVELSALNRLSSQLLAKQSMEDLSKTIAVELEAMTGAERVLLFLSGRQGAEPFGDTAPTFCESAFADWVLRENKAVGLPPRRPNEAFREGWPVSVDHKDAVDCGEVSGVYVPLQVGTAMEGVLAVILPPGRIPDVNDARLIVSAANLTTAFLDRVRLEHAASAARSLEESERLKSNLISSVSHELKTPLAAVTARVSGLLEPDSDLTEDRVRSELDAVYVDLGRLDASIGDLVDVSRLESDSWQPRPDSYEIGEIVSAMTKKLPPAWRRRLEFDVPQDLPPVRVDFAQLTRAIRNLVDNALTYSDGPVRIGARVLGREMLLTVEDSGPGISDDELTAVFEKFRRGTAAAGHPSGTGLGLPISRELARIHGGRVWAENLEPHGARFVMALPLPAPEEERADDGT